MFAKALILGLAAAANAHIVMHTPSGWTPPSDNGPVAADMSNFPCKMNGRSYDRSKTTTYSLGSTNTLRLQGSAVHGGGSGQLSITYDTNPTKNSKWKVIKSFIGGMPARSATGNLAGDMNTLGPDTYSFTVPSNIPAGDATLAWSWINKVGQREFYMSCGPIKLTGSGGSKSNYDALPDMFVANIGSYCRIPEGQDVIFPNAGSQVERAQGGNANPQNPPAECGKMVTPPGGVFVPTDPPTETKPPTTQPTKPPTNTNPPSGAQTPGSPCSQAGAYICLTTSFQQCGSGTWSVVQPVAGGTKCVQGANGSMTIVLAKRSRTGATLSD